MRCLLGFHLDLVLAMKLCDFFGWRTAIPVRRCVRTSQSSSQLRISVCDVRELNINLDCFCHVDVYM